MNAIRKKLRLQFSIATLFLISLVAALMTWIAVWIQQEDAVEGARSWERAGLDQFATAIIRQDSESDAWNKCGVDFGLSTLVSIESGSELFGSTGGEYSAVFFVLPESLSTGEEFELTPPHTSVCENCQYCSLTPGQIIIHRHGSPFNYRLESRSEQLRTGHVSIVRSSEDSVVMDLEIDAKLVDATSPGEYFIFVMEKRFSFELNGSNRSEGTEVVLKPRGADHLTEVND